MNIISDTNIFLAVVLDEPEKENIIQLTAKSNAISPNILPYEVGNALSDALVKSPIRLNIFVTIRKRMHIMDSKPSS